MKRLNITLPDDINNELKTIKNKSKFIAQALKEKFEREREKQLKIKLKEGYKAMVSEEKELMSDWENTEVEGL